MFARNDRTDPEGKYFCGFFSMIVGIISVIIKYNNTDRFAQENLNNSTQQFDFIIEKNYVDFLKTFLGNLFK